MQVCSGFFMVNIVFIIIVLLLQVQKDCIHIEWPLGPRYNHTIIPCNTDSREPIWVVTRLQLEPIGLVFLLFFMSILIIQVFELFFFFKALLVQFLFCIFCKKSIAGR